MQIIKEKQIENLIKHGVIIATQEYLVREGNDKENIGNVSRESYGNWESDRNRLCQNEPQEIVDAVMAIWGTVPTMEEPGPISATTH